MGVQHVVCRGQLMRSPGSLRSLSSGGFSKIHQSMLCFFFSSNFMYFVTLVMSDLFLGQLLLRMVIVTVVLFSDPSILTQMQGHKIYSVWSLPKQGQDRQWMQALCAEYSQQTEREGPSCQQTTPDIVDRITIDNPPGKTIYFEIKRTTCVPLFNYIF